MVQELKERVAGLAPWGGRPVAVRDLKGGLSNTSFVVEDRAERFVVRCGQDLPVHHVFRDHECAASRAAHAAGLSPELVHSEPGVMVFRFVAGRTWAELDMRTSIGPLATLL